MLALLLPLALAYETDPLSGRAHPPADILAAANAEVDTLLSEAVFETNRRAKCARSPERTRRLLARQVFRATARQTQVPGKGFFHRFGHGVYAAWLETAAPARQDHLRRDHLFGELGLLRSPIFRTAGPAATVTVAGVVMGTDKLHHFFSLGYDYARRGRWGEDPERAVRYGHRSEIFPFGLLTSQAYSFADLRANYAGFTFYVGLLEPGSPLALDERGCVARVEGWDWADWVDPAFDELVNPSVYAGVVQRALEERLAEDRAALCEGWPGWGPEVLAERAALAAEEPVWVRADRAPEQGDPFDLARLCGG